MNWNLIQEYEHLFPGIPTWTDKINHDMDIAGSKPVKQHPYRMNLIKPTISQGRNSIFAEQWLYWAKPNWLDLSCIRIGTFRICTDYGKTDSVTKTDTFLISRNDDCIDNIGRANYLCYHFDLLKWLRQIPLEDTANEISAFVTPDGLYQYKVIPFGMKNSPTTFQRLTKGLISNWMAIKPILMMSSSSGMNRIAPKDYQSILR